MKRTKWSVGLRNKLSSLYDECDSAAAIEEAKMSSTERRVLKELLTNVVYWIDCHLKS